MSKRILQMNDQTAPVKLLHAPNPVKTESLLIVASSLSQRDIRARTSKEFAEATESARSHRSSLRSRSCSGKPEKECQISEIHDSESSLQIVAVMEDLQQAETAFLQEINNPVVTQINKIRSHCHKWKEQKPNSPRKVRLVKQVKAASHQTAKPTF